MVELSQSQLRQFTPQTQVRFNQFQEQQRAQQSQPNNNPTLNIQSIPAIQSEQEVSRNERLNSAVRAGLLNKNITQYGLNREELNLARELIRKAERSRDFNAKISADATIRNIENQQQRSLSPELRKDILDAYLSPGNIESLNRSLSVPQASFQTNQQPNFSQQNLSFAPTQSTILNPQTNLARESFFPGSAQSSYQNLLAGAQPISRVPQTNMNYYEKTKNLFSNAYDYVKQPIPAGAENVGGEFAKNPVGFPARVAFRTGASTIKALSDIEQKGQEGLTGFSIRGSQGLTNLGQTVGLPSSLVRTVSKTAGFAGENALYFFPAGIVIKGVAGGLRALQSGNYLEAGTNTGLALTGPLASGGTVSKIGAGLLASSIGGLSAVQLDDVQKRTTSQIRDLEVQERNLRLDYRGTNDESVRSQIAERLQDVQSRKLELEKYKDEILNVETGAVTGTVIGAGATGGLFGSNINTRIKANRIGIDSENYEALRSAQPGTQEYANARFQAMNNLQKNNGILFTDTRNLNKEFPSALSIAEKQNLAERSRFQNQFSNLGVGNSFLELGVTTGEDVSKGFDFIGLGKQGVNPFESGTNNKPFAIAIQPFKGAITDYQQSRILSSQAANQRPVGANPFFGEGRRFSVSISSPENSAEVSATTSGTINNPRGVRFQVIKPSEEGGGALILQVKKGRNTRVTPKGQNLSPKAKVDIQNTFKPVDVSVAKAQEPVINEIFTDENGNRYFTRDYNVEISRVKSGGKRINVESFQKFIGDKPIAENNLNKLASSSPKVQQIAVREFIKQTPDGMFSVLKVDEKAGIAEGRLGVKSNFDRAFVRTGNSEVPFKRFDFSELPNRPSAPGRFIVDSEGKVTKTSFGNADWQQGLVRAENKGGTFTETQVKSPRILDTSQIKPFPDIKSPVGKISQTPVEQLPTMVGGAGKLAGNFAGKTFQIRNTFQPDSSFTNPSTKEKIETQVRSNVGFKELSVQLPSLQTRPALKISPVQSAIPISKGSIIQEQSPLLAQAQPVLLQQQSQQTSIQRPVFSPGRITNPPVVRNPLVPRKPLIRVPLPSKKRLNTDEMELARRRQQILAIAQLKRRGKFLNVSGATSPDLALQIGIGAARRTLGRTFRLIGSGNTKTSDIKINSQPNRDIFRAPYGKKAQPLTFVEKKPFALRGSPGAVKEIIASRSRGIFSIR